MDAYQLIHGECLEELRKLEPNSLDSLVTDPPAGISFMGKDWDKSHGYIPSMTEIFKECLRVLKPGAHGLVWAIPRTSHWTATALEDAGFEIRDVVTHLFGSGFPKSLDISKAIDKLENAEREIIGYKKQGTRSMFDGGKPRPASLPAREWSGFGTALKPASEHWILVRKPISEKTVAANVLKWGCGGLNIDASRISVDPNDPNHRNSTGGYVKTASEATIPNAPYNKSRGATLTQGRFPANLILSHNEDCEILEAALGVDKDHSEPTKLTPDKMACTPGCAVSMLDEQSGVTKEPLRIEQVDKSICGGSSKSFKGVRGHGDSGGASRFFYVAKASKRERNEGCEGLPELECGIGDDRPSGQSGSRLDGRDARKMPNIHPTVKPIRLMQYLITLITPPNGTVLDPFAGSGSTGVAALRSGFKFIGIERELEYTSIAKARLEYERDQRHGAA
jgi:hypothetical protein